MRVEPLTEKDRNKVRALELFCMRESLEPLMTKRWDDLSQELVDQLGASARHSLDHYISSGLSFVAKEGRTVVGFIFAHTVEHIYNIPLVVWIENIGVHPSHRRSGIGYALLRKVVEEGKKRGAKAVHSAIMPDNAESIMLHKKVGFFVDVRKIALLDLESVK